MFGLFNFLGSLSLSVGYPSAERRCDQLKPLGTVRVHLNTFENRFTQQQNWIHSGICGDIGRWDLKGMGTHTHTGAYIYIYMYTSMYTCIYIYMYVCVYTHYVSAAALPPTLGKIEVASTTAAGSVDLKISRGNDVCNQQRLYIIGTAKKYLCLTPYARFWLGTTYNVVVCNICCCCCYHFHSFCQSIIK